MTSSLYATAVPVFKQMLGGLAAVLDLAQTQAEARGIEPAALLQARLAPDMFPMLRQVRVACDFAKSVSARLANTDVPAFEDNEQGFADLQARIAKTLAFIDGQCSQCLKLHHRNVRDESHIVATWNCWAPNVVLSVLRSEIPLRGHKEKE